MTIKTLVKSNINTLNLLNKNFKTITKNTEFCNSFFKKKNDKFFGNNLIHKFDNNFLISDNLASIIDLIRKLQVQNSEPPINSNTTINEKIFNQLKTELNKNRTFLTQENLTNVEKISNNLLDKNTLNKLLSSLLNDLKKKLISQNQNNLYDSQNIPKKNINISENITTSKFFKKYNFIFEKLPSTLPHFYKNYLQLLKHSPKNSIIDKKILNINKTNLLEKNTVLQKSILKNKLKNIHEYKFFNTQSTTIPSKKQILIPTLQNSYNKIQNTFNQNIYDFINRKQNLTRKFISTVFYRQKEKLSNEVKNIFQEHISNKTELINLEKSENVTEKKVKKVRLNKKKNQIKIH